MAKRDTWFRNDLWDEAEQAAFFARLARCRTQYNRLQYLRLKAYHLTESGDSIKLEAAISLYLQECREAEEAAKHLSPKRAFFLQCAKNAQIHVAAVRELQGNIEAALLHYRDALSRETSAPDVYILKMAKVILETKRTSEYPVMLDLLYTSWQKNQLVLAFFRYQLFQYAYLQAIFADELNRPDAVNFAQTALSIVNAPEHGIRPEVIRPGQATSTELAMLENIISKNNLV